MNNTVGVDTRLKIMWAMIVLVPAFILLGSLICGIVGIVAFFEANHLFLSGAPIVKLNEETDNIVFLALPVGALLYFLALRLRKNAVPWWSIYPLILALLVAFAVGQSRALEQLSAAHGYSYCPALDKLGPGLRGGPNTSHWDWAYTLPGKCPGP